MATGEIEDHGYWIRRRVKGGIIGGTNEYKAMCVECHWEGPWTSIQPLAVEHGQKHVREFSGQTV